MSMQKHKSLTPRKPNAPGVASKWVRFALLFLVACKPQPKVSEASSNDMIAAVDSLWKKPKEALVAEVDSFVVHHKTPVLVPFPKYSATDSIQVWQPDSASARISVELHTQEGLSWPTFHYVQGELVRVRYREWRQVPGDTSTLEAMVYLQGDSILYCEERTRPLHGLETPGLLRAEPFFPTVRTRAELRTRYLREWPDVLKVLGDSGIELWSPGIQ